jgi:CBS domain-containing protein
MTLKEAMTREIHTIKPEDTIQHAASLMKEQNVGLLPVLENGRPIGVVTDRDLTIRATASALDPKTTPVRRAMTNDLMTLKEDQDLEDAINLMKNKQIGRVLVQDKNGALVGILSASDAAMLCKGDQRIGKLAEGIAHRTHSKAAHGRASIR